MADQKDTPVLRLVRELGNLHDLMSFAARSEYYRSTRRLPYRGDTDEGVAHYNQVLASGRSCSLVCGDIANTLHTVIFEIMEIKESSPPGTVNAPQIPDDGIPVPQEVLMNMHLDYNNTDAENSHSQQQSQKIQQSQQSLIFARTTPPRRPRTFSDLPSEIRVMIWKAASLPPASLEYFQGTEQETHLRTIETPALPYQTAALPVSVLLPDRGLWMACKESRYEIKKAYRKAYARLIAAPGDVFPRPAPARVLAPVPAPPAADNNANNNQNSQNVDGGDSSPLINVDDGDDGNDFESKYFEDSLAEYYTRLIELNEDGRCVQQLFVELATNYPDAYAEYHVPPIEAINNLFVAIDEDD